MTDSLQAGLSERGNGASPNGSGPSSLGTTAARNLTTTTKTPPQMQGISSRWLLKMIPWVQVNGGTFRVNRRVTYTLGTGKVGFTNNGDEVRVIPPTLTELPVLHGIDDADLLAALAGRFTVRTVSAGEVITEPDRPIDTLYLIAHGKFTTTRPGKFGDTATLDTLADGHHLGEEALRPEESTWTHATTAQTDGIVLALSRQVFQELLDSAPQLREHVEHRHDRSQLPQNAHGEAEIDVASGHDGEPVLPTTFADYETQPREYELSVAQTVLRIHTRVADLYNDPMNQTEHQLRLTIEALRERQEHEVVNNRKFGLLHNADLKQRIHTRSGPPTPDDLDDLLGQVWKEPSFFLAHPKAIAAFGRECSHAGIYPDSVPVNGHMVPGWRGVPIFPCNKIPVGDGHTTSIMLLRAGEQNQGVVGLHQTGIPDEYQPGLSVRFMNINEQAIMSYLVSAYYSAAVLVPDALAVLDNVEIGRHHDDA
jgi:CRP-like cAMP-binding protein